MPETTQLNEPPDEQVQKAKQPHKDEFRGLVERTWQKAYWTAFDIVGDAAEAEDLCQEGLLRAYERWDEFRHQSSPDTWVYRIVVNLCLNHRRRKGIWHRISHALRLQAEESVTWEAHSSFLNPERRLQDRQTAESIHRAMKMLSDHQRTVFSLRYLQGFTLQEIADITDSALGTVKSHMFRALKSMRRHLTEQQMGELLE